MNGKYLLDSNIVIGLFADDPRIILEIRYAEEIFIPCIVIGELYYGAEKSVKTEENMKRIDEFVFSNVILNCDGNTAKQYGIIKNRLREKGRPIPENDIWIAAIALQHNLTLITRDEHFKEVGNLKTEKW